MRNFLLAIAGFLTAIIGSACHSSHEHQEEPRKLLTTTPLVQDTTITRDYVCQIRAIQHIELRALERGYLQKIHVDEGQFVKAGQLMFEIMPSLYQAEFNKAAAEASFAKIEFQNTATLAEKKVVAPSELALARAKLDKANAELALAQVHLDFTQVRAPFDGIMDHFYVREGSLLEEGELLTTLSDNHQMWVYFNVPETEYLEYKKSRATDSGMQVRLRMANNQLFDQAGQVTAIEADFNNETGNIAYRATFPNPDRLLRHGQTGNVLVDSPIHDAMLVPQKAVVDILDKRYVFVVNDTGKVSLREVKVGAVIPDIFVISEGLGEGEKFLLEGVRKVRDGDLVVPDLQDSSKVFANLKVYAE